MANPARKLNAQLQNEVIFAELGTSVSDGINEEYAIRVPRQMDSEKKIWLYAASHTVGSRSLPHSGVR